MNQEISKHTERYGLFACVPRFLRTSVIARLMELEAQDAAFDRVALLHRAKLKQLYAVLHVRPGAQAQTLLFGKAPEGSALGALKQLGRSVTPKQAARLVRDHQLPMLLVESALGTLSEPVALALVESMPDDELVSRLPLLARRGLLEGRVRRAVLRRLIEMASPVPYAKAASVIRQAKLDRELSDALAQRVGMPRSVRSAIPGDTALLVDASLSMGGGFLSLAGRVARSIDLALVPEAKLFVVAFGAGAKKVPVTRGFDLDTFQTLLSRASDDLVRGTSAGAAVAAVKAKVARFVVITDGYENRPPKLASALSAYREQHGVMPDVVLAQPHDAGIQLAVDLKNAAIAYRVFQLGHDVLGLDALEGVLSSSPVEPADEILAMP